MGRKRQAFFNFPLGNKRALSPLVATILLVIFALVIGTITMNWGKTYVEQVAAKEEKSPASIVIDISSLDDPLKVLQIKYLAGEISKEEYFKEEKKLG